MATRALPDLIARIKIDSTGVDAAMQNLVGSFGKANMALVGLAATVGIVILGVRSMMDIARAEADAEGNLTAALTARGLKANALDADIAKFINTNRQYVASQADVINGFAALTREGVSATETQKLMSIAVDISAAQNISLSDAVTLLQSAEGGRTVGLKKLVGITLEAIPANATLAQKQAIIAHNMDIVAAAYKGAAANQDSLTKSTNSLGITWEKFATGPGKKFNDALAAGAGIVDLLLQFLQEMGHDNAIWNAIEGKLIAFAQWIHTYIIGPLEAVKNFIDWTEANTHGAGTSGQQKGPGRGARASGGPVVPGSIYTVGENGPETLVMGPIGGMVIPNASGATQSPDTTRIEALLEQLIACVSTQPTGQTGVEAAIYKVMTAGGMNRLRGMAGA